MPQKTKVWLDCDPGLDDAFAIVMTAFSDAIDLVGISTISGNQTTDKVTRNALKVVNLCGLIVNPTVNLKDQDPKQPLRLEDSLSHGGLKFPIIKGSNKPLFRPVRLSAHIHGDSGLDTHEPVDFPEIPPHAVEFTDRLACQTSPHFTTRIYDFFRSLAPEKITIVAIGPLTNIALLLINHPDVVNYIDKLVLMGGSIGYGNNGPAEFNILVDPEAAALVFESSLEIYMVPLEITRTALADQSVLDRIEAPQTEFSKIMASMLKYYRSTISKFFDRADPPLHDPCAVAFVIDPSIFEYRLMRVEVETTSALTSGLTVCDIYGYPLYADRRKNVHVCLEMNVPRFWDMLIETLVKANENSLTRKS